MSELDAHGLSLDAPAGWEARIFKRAEVGDIRAADAAGAAVVAGAVAPIGERMYPIIQAGTVPLPMDMADYGSDVVEDLGATDALVVLKEFDPADAGQPLFASEGLPQQLTVDDFDPATLQRRLDGQAGYQGFFHESGRAFCVYVVVGSYDRRGDVLPGINRVLGTIQIEPLSATTEGVS